MQPGDKVYKNRGVGIHQRPGDLLVNVSRRKQLTNICTADKEVSKGILGAIDFCRMTLLNTSDTTKWPKLHRKV